MTDEIDRIRELEQQIERLSLFYEVGKAVASTLDLQKVLETIMQKISDFLQPDTWSLLMVDEKCNELYHEIAIGAGASPRGCARLRPSHLTWSAEPTCPPHPRGGGGRCGEDRAGQPGRGDEQRSSKVGPPGVRGLSASTPSASSGAPREPSS